MSKKKRFIMTMNRLITQKLTKTIRIYNYYISFKAAISLSL